MLTDPLHSPIGNPTAWEPLAHNTLNQATGGIWRVTGPGGTAILKHATSTGEGAGHWPASTDPHHWNYWQREYLAYNTGAVAEYCDRADLTAPAMLAAGERPDGSVELWLEALDAPSPAHWSLDQLAYTARQLGIAQASLREEPEQPWGSRRFLRTYAGRRDFGQIPWDHPLIAAHWPENLRDGLRRIWERRTDLFDLAEALPQTLCHLDLWPMNLTHRTHTPALLDWAFTGTGAIGEDLANLIPDTFFDGLAPIDELEATESALIDAYLTGLAEAGYRGEDTTRKAIAATGAAKYAWLAPAMLTGLTAGKPAASANYDTESDDAAVLRRRAPIFTMLVRWASAALDS